YTPLCRSVRFTCARREIADWCSPETCSCRSSCLSLHDALPICSLYVREPQESGSEVPGNMFVPIDLLRPILADLIEKGRRPAPARPWLGLATEELHGHLLVTRVSPEGPAKDAQARS